MQKTFHTNYQTGPEVRRRQIRGKLKQIKDEVESILDALYDPEISQSLARGYSERLRVLRQCAEAYEQELKSLHLA